MFNRKHTNNVSISHVIAHINEDGSYNLSFGITRLIRIDLFDFNQALIKYRIPRDSIMWGSPDKELEALYYASN